MGYTTSSQHQTSKKNTAGHTPSLSGHFQLIAMPREIPSLRVQRSRTLKMVRQGSSPGQKFPSNMTAKDIPTHQMIQTNVGARFINGSAEPHSADTIVSAKSRHATLLVRQMNQ